MPTPNTQHQTPMVKVLVFGTFDGLHEGHLDFFRQAKEYGDFLIVVVARDSTVKRVKKRGPKYNEQERLKSVLTNRPPLCGATGVPAGPARELVNEARLGNEGNNPYKVIEEIKPDIICLGYDQSHFTDKLKQKLKEMSLSHIKIKRLKAYKPEQYKSSLLNR